MGGKVGMFGGSFDPVHLSHVALAHAALGYGLDRVVLVPCRIAPHKDHRPVDARHRWIMLETAFDGEPRIELSAFELESDEISYTHKTIEHLQSLHPGTRLTLILGYDQFATLSSWKLFSEWGRKIDYLIFPRDGSPTSIPPKLADLNITFATENLPPISSSFIRQEIEAGRSLEKLLPPAVADYITRHKLYLNGTVKPS